MEKELIARIKYLSNIDHCQSAEDLQYALEKIYDLIEKHHPEITEENSK
jgi:hypothetical protein